MVAVRERKGRLGVDRSAASWMRFVGEDRGTHGGCDTICRHLFSQAGCDWADSERVPRLSREREAAILVKKLSVSTAHAVMERQ